MARPAPAGPANWVGGSRQADNAWILYQIREADLSGALAIVQALAQRADPDVGEVLNGLDADAGGRSSFRAEHLLRVLLEPICRDPRRLAANTETLSRMARDLSRYEEPLLRARLLSLVPLLPGLPAASVLMREGHRLADRLPGGSPPLEVEAAFFLEAARRVGGAELGETCRRIAEGTTSPVLAREARRTARELLAE